MRLLRDLWATSPGRLAAVLLLIVLGAAGQAAAAALAGPVLLYRSIAAVRRCSPSRWSSAVLGDLAVGLIVARLTADWSADVRRRLCRVAFGQDLPTLETTPVGELLDRIDGDVYQVARRAARQRRADRAVAGRSACCRSSPRCSSGGRPASAMLVLVRCSLADACASRPQRIAPGPDRPRRRPGRTSPR